MNPINTISFRSLSLLRVFGLLFLTGALAACTNPMEVTPDDEPIIEEPAPAAKTYQVDIHFKRIRVVGDCEEDPIITIKGQFAYRLSVSSQRPDGSWTSPTVVTQTRRYGSKDGDVVKRASGSDINVNRTHTLVLPDDANYRMHLSAIEWDEFGKKDHRMDGKTATEENSAGGSKLKYEHGLNLGPNTYCRLKLYVDAKETLL